MHNIETEIMQFNLRKSSLEQSLGDKELSFDSWVTVLYSFFYQQSVTIDLV